MKEIDELKKLIKTSSNVVCYENILNALNELENYKELEKQGKLIVFPCKVGDYVEFSDGSIRPVVSLTKSNDGDINVCCQNGHIISMQLQYPSWAKRFISKEEYENK